MTELTERITRNVEAMQRIAVDIRGQRESEAPTERAAQAVKGKLVFLHLRERYVDVGRSDIDWSGAHVAHQEWPAQLNRFFQLPSLAGAYEATGDDCYAEAARDYISDWIGAHQSRADWELGSGDNTLNLSIRMLCWFANLPPLLGSAAFDAPFVQQMVESATVQLDYLQDNISPSINWRIAHADTLVTCGLYLDFVPRSREWREFGVAVINETFHRQVLSDGVHSERNPSYHGWMTRVFEKWWRVGRVRPELRLVVTSDVLANMHDYSVAVLRPHGAMNATHDCSGEHTGQRTPAWADARRRFRVDAGLADELPSTTQVFDHAGQVMMRDSWDEDTVYITFDASTWGGGHCHLSRNAVQLDAFGRSLLVDPGTLTYEGSDPMMAHGKSTRAHNTVNLNGLNQSTADPTMCHQATAGYDFVIATYDGGYWPGKLGWDFNDGLGAGVWAEHTRMLLWARDRCVFVIDYIGHRQTDTDGKPTVELNWQFSEGEVALDTDLAQAVTNHDDGNVMVIVPVRPDSSVVSMHCGEQDPPRGWLRGADAYIPGQQLCVSVPKCDPWHLHLVSVLIPFRGSDVPGPAVLEAQPPEVDGCGRLAMRWADGTTDELLWTGTLDRALFDVSEEGSDAGLIHRVRDARGQLMRGVAIGGTYALPHVTDPHPARTMFSLC